MRCNIMINELKAIKSTKKELRQFGYIMAAAGAIIGGILLWKGRPAYPWFLGAGGFFLLAGLAVPAVLLPLQKVWMAFAVIMGWIMTRVILTILYYLIVTPIGLLARIVGKDFLERKIRKDQASYWVPVEQKPFDPKRYENQF